MAGQVFAVMAAVALVVPSLVAVGPAQSASAAPAAPAASAVTPDAVGGTRPDAISAASAARASGKPVEVTGDRSETGSVFANPDGTFTYSSYGATKHLQRDGAWVQVDTRLKAAAGGRLVPGVVKADLSLSGDGKGSAATLKSDGQSIDLGWAGSLPAPTISGNTATYADVLPNTDFVQTALVGGVEQSLVLKKRVTALPAWNIPLKLSSGLKAVHKGDNSLSLQNLAGKPLLQSSPAIAYDAAGREAPVTTRLVTTSAGTSISVVPDLAWLLDPETTYPVVIDPSTSINEINHTYINSLTPTANYSTDAWLTLGKNTDGSVRRSFIGFNTGPFVGAHVISATAYAHAAVPGTTSNRVDMWDAAQITAATTWNNPPAVYNNWASSTSIPASNWQSWSATSMMQTFAANKVYKGTIQLRAFDESSTLSYKRYDSGQAGTNYPHMDITYNKYPTTPISQGTSPVGLPHYTNKTTPTLVATGTDPDGGTLRYDYAVYTYGGGPLVASGSVSGVASGGTARWTVPASAGLTNGQHYGWRVKTWDGTDYSALSDWDDFYVDTTIPAAPTISSSSHPAGVWTSNPSGTFSWTAGPSDTAGYLYGLDQASPSTATTATSVSLTGMADGTHTLNVRTKDKAGNLSPVAAYSFSVGTVALTSPADGDRTQARVTLSGQAPSSFPSVTYRYRIGADTATAFTDIPTGDVLIPGGSTHPTWPMTRTSGNFPDLTWNVAATLGSGAADGPVQVQACFGSTCSSSSTLQYSRHQFNASNAFEALGPGTLSLLTGDLAVNATDANVSSYNGSMTIGRSATSLLPAPASAEADGVYGPGWTADLQGPASGGGGQKLDDHTSTSSGYAAVTAPYGAQRLYLHTSGSTYPYGFTGKGDAGGDGSILTKTSATSYELLGPDKSKTAWSLISGDWVVTSVTEDGSDSVSTFTYNAAGQATRILGPVPPGVICSNPLPAGCRALELSYATTTTAIGGSLGDYSGRMSSITLTVGGSTPIATQVTKYRYDSTGHLREVWDPRLDSGGGANLKTVYTYDVAGRLATVSPPGLATWTLTYDGAGRLSEVSRPDPTSATARITVAYDIPLSGPGLPSVDGLSVSTWGQDDVPATGTATFPATHVPTSPPGTSDWAFAKLSYLDVNGRATNTAAYGAGGWQLSTDEYDQFGNVVRQLTPGNRAQALVPTLSTDPTVSAIGDPATRASMLDTQFTYDASDYTVIDVLGATHPFVSSAHVLMNGRKHDHILYDQGAPGIIPLWLPTTVTSSTATTSGDVDSRVSVLGYEPKVVGDTATSGWTLGVKTSETVRMGPGGTASANDIKKLTFYNAEGQVVERRSASDSSSGTGAGTTLNSYYTATGTGACVSPSWAGLLCTSGPASQPTTGPTIPTTAYTGYNSLLQPTVVTETSGSVVRTTTTTYDSAGRVTSRSVTTVNDGSAAVAMSTISYDALTGLTLSVSRGGQSISTVYDNLGRASTVTDAAGNVSTLTYTLDGQMASLADGKGTTTYSYDSSSEHRRLVTSFDVGAGAALSNFSVTYNADAQQDSLTYPSGLLQTSLFDNTSKEVTRSYSQGGVELARYAETTTGLGQISGELSPLGSRQFDYDQAGRVSVTRDTRTASLGAVCTTRTYTFDVDSDRTGLTATPDDGSNAVDGACSTSTTASSVPQTYDAANRITSAGYSHDGLGRTVAIPAVDAGGVSGMTLSYFANDRVATQAQGGTTLTYGLDPSDRVQVTTNSTTGDLLTNHYSSGSDAPSWVGSSSGSWSRNLTTPDGQLAAIQTSAGGVALQLTDLHGNVVATAEDSAGQPALSSATDFDEYGNPYGAGTGSDRYGFQGAAMRSSDALGGTVLMGRRLYQPSIGRFLQVDSVLGASANAYDYCDQDSPNCSDISGEYPALGNPAEQSWCKGNYGTRILLCILAKGRADTSLSYTRFFFGGTAGNGYADAFQHILWAMLMSKAFGTGTAEGFLNRHELGAKGEPLNEFLMDWGNNHVGLGTFAAYGFSKRTNDSELVTVALRLVFAGACYVLVYANDAH